MTPAVQQQLQALEQLIFALEDQYKRINHERQQLLAGRAAAIIAFPPLALLDVGELRTRADSMLALLDVIELHMVDRLPRLEERARAGDLGAAQKAVTSTQRILEAVGGVSPVSELIDDTKTMVKDIVDDARDTGIGIGIGAVVVLAVAGVLALVLRR